MMIVHGAGRAVVVVGVVVGMGVALGNHPHHPVVRNWPAKGEGWELIHYGSMWHVVWSRFAGCDGMMMMAQDITDWIVARTNPRHKSIDFGPWVCPG